MALKLRSFAQPDLLKKIKPEHLLRLLDPHRLFFKMKGLSLPADADSELDYLGLAGVLAQPDEEMNSDLVEALHLIGNFGGEEYYDDLLDVAIREGLPVDPDATAPDLATQVYLHDPQILERKEREQLFQRRKTFESYRAANPDEVVQAEELPEDLTPLEQDLDRYFESKKRGIGCRIIRKDSNGEVRFLVQHGQACKREPSRKGAQSTCTFFRPEKTDVVIYDVAHNELRINAHNLPDLRQYRAFFGRHVFGDEEKFVYAEKYTLEPLKEGPNSLQCRGVPGIESVSLCEIEYGWGGAFDHVEHHRAGDIFKALMLRDRTIDTEAHIRKAVFKIKLTGERKARTVTVRAGNKSGYNRGEEATLIENWLWERGFVLTQPVEDHEEAEAALAGS